MVAGRSSRFKNQSADLNGPQERFFELASMAQIFSLPGVEQVHGSQHFPGLPTKKSALQQTGKSALRPSQQSPQTQ